MFVINLIPGCHFRATEEAEIVGMDEVELGEYVVDYAYHDRDLEGNCPLPPRPYSSSNEGDEKAQGNQGLALTQSRSRRGDTSLIRQASPRSEPQGDHHTAGAGGQEVYPGGRGEGRMIYPDGEEQVTEKRG